MSTNTGNRLGNWLASGSSTVMGSVDRIMFDFNQPFSPTEKLNLLLSNPTVGMATYWVSQEALKHGILFKTNNEANQKLLKAFNLKIEFIKAMTWAKLFGESIILVTDSVKQPTEELDATSLTLSVKAYHPLVPSVGGWEIQKSDLDEGGNPKTITYHQTVNASGSMATLMPIKIPVGRVIFFKNPELTNGWKGSSSVTSLLHMAHIEQLILRMICKRALIIGAGMFVISGVSNENEASSIHTALNGGMADEIILKNPNVKIEYAGPTSVGNANITELFEILASYQARAMRVSRQAMDGAPEGTLSSSTTNMSFSYSTIEATQNTFESAIDETLKKIGITDEWEYVNPVTDVSEESSESNSTQTGTSQTESKESPTKSSVSQTK